MVRAYEQFRSRQSALAKNTFMTSMKDQNVVLYYKVDRRVLHQSDRAI